MKRRLALLAAAALLGAGVSACSDPPDHGYIWSLNYEPSSTIWWPGHYYSTCYGSGSSRRCTRSYSPGYFEYVPEKWQLDLCQKPGAPSGSNSCGWRDVDSQTYHSVRLGQFWTSVAGTPATSTP